MYKELRLRGYNYGGAFRGIRTVNWGAADGELDWNGNWISFMDTMLQYLIISNHKNITVRTFIVSSH